MAAISTVNYHIQSAVNLYNTELWFVLAREAEWPSGVPVAPTADSELDGPWCYRKTEVKYLVVPDDVNGTIEYKGQKFRIVLPSAAFVEGARWVYVMTNLYYNEVPLKPYGQIGLNSNVVPNEDIPAGQQVLLPEELKSEGTTLFIDNRGTITRQVDQKEQLVVIIEC